MTIPAIGRRPTAHRKSACWTHCRLDCPTTNLSYQSRGLRSKGTDTAADQSRWCHLRQRLHTPTPDVPAGHRSQSPANTVARTRTSGVFRANPAPPDQVHAFPQVTGLRPKALRTAKTAPFRYPHWVYEGGLGTAFPQVRGPLAHVVAGEGFEPSKLSRWIYRPPAASP